MISSKQRIFFSKNACFHDFSVNCLNSDKIHEYCVIPEFKLLIMNVVHRREAANRSYLANGQCHYTLHNDIIIIKIYPKISKCAPFVDAKHYLNIKRINEWARSPTIHTAKNVEIERMGFRNETGLAKCLIATYVLVWSWSYSFKVWPMEWWVFHFF